MGKRDISGDAQVKVPDPSKWDTPHDYGEGKHAGELEREDDEDEEDPASDDD
ncbi:MAG: hypothetical protein ACRDQ4_17435 [Pseudonocardiaceae bacterium]